MDGAHVEKSSYYLSFDHLKPNGFKLQAEEQFYGLPERFILTPIYPSNISLEVSVMELRFTNPNP